MDFREKYRPKRFSEFVGNGDAILLLKNIIKSRDLPTGILIYGPPGSGKTTLARVFLKGLHCDNFTEDVCGQCDDCRFFDTETYGAGPCLFSKFSYHDCTAINKARMDYILSLLPLDSHLESKVGRTIHVFDEFHRIKEPLQERLLYHLEKRPQRLLLIFCAIDMKVIRPEFRQRVTKVPTEVPELDELIPWLQGICDSEGIVIKGGDVLRQIASSANRLPRECVSFLEKIHLLGKPLTTTLVKELAEDQEFNGPQYGLAP